jgi:hypothetical protein
MFHSLFHYQLQGTVKYLSYWVSIDYMAFLSGFVNIGRVFQKFKFDTHNITEMSWGSLQTADIDCGFWIWQLFALGKANVPCLWPCLSVINTLGWSAVVFCACEIVQLFSVVFYVVRAVYEFDFRPVLKEPPNIRRPVLVIKQYVMQWCILMF